VSGTPAFTCPCCGSVSHHPSDTEQGYCGRCHWWTGDPVLGPPHLAESCGQRANPEFEAFRQEFCGHLLAGLPQDEQDLWRELR
jgi:hypothetical protein